MPAAQRMDDLNDGGGKITSIPQTTVFVNNKLLSVDGSTGTGHPSGNIHNAGVWKTANGNTTVLINGVAVNADGDPDTCKHTRVNGSANVNIG